MRVASEIRQQDESQGENSNCRCGAALIANVLAMPLKYVSSGFVVFEVTMVSRI